MFNKRLMAVSLLVLLFLPLFSSSAAAQEKTISDTLYETVSSVFGFMDQIQISLIGEQGDAAAKSTFWARFLIWILVFTICYYDFRLFLPGHIAGTIGFVLALISVLGIPGTLLRDIIINYSLIATLVLLGGPILGLLLFRFKMKQQHGGSVWTHVGFVLLDVFILILLIKFMASLNTTFSSVISSWQSITQWSSLFLVGMVIILAFDIFDVWRAAKGRYTQPYMPSIIPGAAGVRDLTQQAERTITDGERLAEIIRQYDHAIQEKEAVSARFAAGEIGLSTRLTAIERQIESIVLDLQQLQREIQSHI